MEFRLWLQLAEAFGPINRWFCSEAFGQEINDPDLLLTYYIKSGGAADFARRYDQAMGRENRWFCSQFYDRDVRDPQTLWEYYTTHVPVRIWEKKTEYEQSDQAFAELSIAC